MTLREFFNAVEGFQELRDQDFQEYMIGVRQISFWAIKGHAGKKIKSPKELFELPIDAIERKARTKKMKPSEVIRHAK